jgi:spore coat polysaccharide biosynthesis protein SpsF
MSTAHTPAELVLGTAQLCDPQASPDAQDGSHRLIHAALNAGVKWIETSPAYAHAEIRIGQALRTARRAHIITRMSPIPVQDASRSVRELVTENISQSCSRLNVDRLDVLTLNSVTEIKSHGGVLWRTLREIRDEGTVYDLGVAVASPEEAMMAIAEPAVTYLQLQFNVLDWRWHEAGVVEALANRPDILVHAHSALLYGMLAGTPGAKWPAIDAIDPEALRLTLWTMAKQMGRDCPADLCINYVRAQPWIHGVIAGAKSTSQLALNIARFKRPALSESEIAQVNAVMPRVPRVALGATSRSRAA